MAGELVCQDCGAVARFIDPEAKVVCPNCGFLLRYGEEREESAAVATATKTRAKTRRRKPVRALQEERIEQRRPTPADESVFVAGNEDGLVVGEVPAEDAWFDNTPRWWQKWLDPVVLLWLPILVPAFTLCSVAFAAGYALRNIRTKAGFEGLGVPLIIFGGVLFAVPAGYFCRHLAEIMRCWAIGDHRDPNWNEFDVLEAVTNFWWWCACAIAAALFVLPIAAILAILPVSTNLLELRAVHAALFVIGSVYFSVAVLAVVMFHSVVACNPLTVLSTVARLFVPLMIYAAELLLHLAVLAGLGWCIFRVWSISFLLVVPLVLIAWTLAILSASRLVRRIGIIYASHADRLGWFRPQEDE